MAVRGFRGVRDDLSELARHFLDIACFISPLLSPAAAAKDSPPPSPTHRRRRRPSPRPPAARVLAGILNDLSEIGGGFRNGLSILSAVFRSETNTEVNSERELVEAVERRAEVVGVSREVVGFVCDLVKCPELWIEFPVIVDEDFVMSNVQREHIGAMERLAQDLAALRVNICPSYMDEKSFWRIYFALLHPRLNVHESELLSTQQILDSMRLALKGTQNQKTPRTGSSLSLISLLSEKGCVVQKEDVHAKPDHMTSRVTSHQSIDQWSEVPSNIDGDGTSQFVSGETSFRNIDNGNLLLMEKYLDSVFGEVSSVDSCSSRKMHASITNENKAPGQNMLQAKMSSDEESGTWQAIEDSSDFEVVDKP